MAFGLYLGCPNDLCDKCNKITEEAVVIIKHSGRYDRNFIYVHQSCLSKAIEKAKKAAEVSA